MKIFIKTLGFLALCFLLFSCKKEGYFYNAKSKLPSYSNVKLDNVFPNGESELKNQDSIVKLLDGYYNRIWVNEDLSGGLLVAKGNKIIYEKYRGYGRQNQTVPIDENTPLHVASVSKTLTAMATMKLVEAGIIKLEDRITKFFPKFPYTDVTVINLLTQRSGLPKYEYFIESIKPEPKEISKRFLNNQDILNMLIRYKPELARPTNTGFMYCNTNFAMLALIIEKVTNTPFPVAMQEIVFRPLKMKHTHIFIEKDTATASQSFYYRGNKLFPLEKLDLIYGDKNVYTTPRDLLNFSVALFSKNFLRPDLKEMIFKPFSNEKKGVNNYGIGFRMKIFDNGEKLTFHNGWWHGSNAVFAHLLKSNVTIVAIGNKYSRRVYSALSLSGLFENFPMETEKLNTEIKNKDSTNLILKDSLKEGNDNYSE